MDYSLISASDYVGRSRPHVSVSESTKLNSIALDPGEDMISTVKHHDKDVSSHQWNPGYLAFFPWISFIALAGSLLSIVAAGVILHLCNKQSSESEDGKKTWILPPNVWLAICAIIGNAFLRFAQREGATISWWISSLSGTDLRTLHTKWRFGMGLGELLLPTSWKLFDKVIIANIATTLCVITGPLLQRSVYFGAQDVLLSRNITISSATNLTNFTTLSVRGFRNNGTEMMSEDMWSVVRDYSSRTPILTQNFEFNGTWSGSLRGLGLNGDCNTYSTSSVDWLSNFDPATFQTPLYNFSDNVTLFETSFPKLYLHPKSFSVSFYNRPSSNISEVYGHPILYFNSTTFTSSEPRTRPMKFSLPYEIWRDYKGAAYDVQTCPGTLTTRQCYYGLAVVDYPIKITGRNLELNGTGPSRVIQNLPIYDLSEQDYHPDITDGIQATAREVFASKYHLRMAEVIFNLLTTHTLELQSMYFAVKSSGLLAQLHRNASNDPYYCIQNFTDPTNEIMAGMHEIMFRTSIAAATVEPNSIQTVLVGQPVVQPFYYADFRFYAAAAAVMMFAVGAVGSTFYGYWVVGRPVSSSPIEIARAFDAPLLNEQGVSNAKAGDLLMAVGDTKVVYGVAEKSSVDGCLRRRLVMGNPEDIVRPRKGDAFD